MKNNIIIKACALVTVFSITTVLGGWGTPGTIVPEADAYYYVDLSNVDWEAVYAAQNLELQNTDTAVTTAPPTSVSSTYVVPSGAKTFLPCPDGFSGCGANASMYYAVPEMCTEADQMMGDLSASVAAGGDVYSVVETYGTWVWTKYNVTTGIGWSGWWVSFANYCVSNGYWASSNASSIVFGGYSTLTFTLAEAPAEGTYAGELVSKTADTITMRGTLSAGGGGGTVTSPTFNSPFIYLDVPDGDYSVSLDSEWDQYQSVAPDFTDTATWDVTVTDGQTTVAGKPYDHLFYELGMHRIDLTRAGRNFSSKDELVSYLEESDFFAKLAMTETEKENSLSYLIPRLPEASNYYLTILEDEAVEALSEITVTPTPEQLVRTYYAVYPTATEVKVESDLVFPQREMGAGSVVKEYGEIIVKPEMYVFWK